MNNQNARGPLSILGDPQVGNTLIARDNAIIDQDGIDYSTLVYSWYANGTLIEGENKQTLVITENLQGKTIAARVDFKDNKGNAEFVETSERSEKKVEYATDQLRTLNVLYTYLS